MDPKVDNYLQYMQSQAWRFQVSFYTIHDHLRDPDYPYTVSAAYIGSANSNPPVVMIQKTAGYPTLTLGNAV